MPPPRSSARLELDGRKVASVTRVVYVSAVDSEEHRLQALLRRSELVSEVLELAPALDLPNWYLGAGSIAQTVWNAAHGFDPVAHIKDCDLVYYDPADTSHEGEDEHIRRAKAVFGHLPVPVEVKNQARVHLWYEQRFGYPIRPYTSVEDAIDSWPTTATSIGVRTGPRTSLVVYAPFGLDDLLGLIVRPNRRQITREIYLEKVERWRRSWPRLEIVPWDGA